MKAYSGFQQRCFMIRKRIVTPKKTFRINGNKIVDNGVRFRNLIPQKVLESTISIAVSKNPVSTFVSAIAARNFMYQAIQV